MKRLALSCLFLGATNAAANFKLLNNTALFAELGTWTLGVETNSAETVRGTESFGLIPQVHHDVSEHFGILVGFRWLMES